MRIWIVVALAAVLVGCGQEGADALQENIERQVRSGFVSVAEEQCMNRLPSGHPLFDEEKARQICGCTAQKLADSLAAGDLAALAGGEIGKEAAAKIQDAALACAKEMITPGSRAASAP
ncbi:hypothetical protein [Bergeriella denitrificans]|uniref:Lipoprotein n=1 Tax=Bergeriella denitrificans TaxID=494 RepID=A0A378UHD5_BERDE|nr:hypothetical protein [Bergeriella denitrificans]STZ76715.1 Uncharacterised protein [Bergeriella denitrificans]